MPLRMRRAAAVLAALLVAATPLATTQAMAAPGNAQIGVALLDGPSNQQNDPRGRIYIVDQVRPGAKVQRHINVSNSSAQTQAISLYAGPASIKDGSILFADAGQASDLTSWTTIDPPAPTVPSGSSITATVDIAVPPDAGNGERYEVIWAQIESAPAPGQTKEVNRVGIRVYLQVSGGTDAVPSGFTIDSLTGARDPENHIATVTARVTNTGERAIDLTGTLQLHDGPSGLRGGPYGTSQPTTIAPGDTESVVFVIPAQVPDGLWTATVDLTSGLVTGTFTGPVMLKAGVATSARPAFPWYLWAIGLLVVALLLLALWWWRRSRDDDQDEGIELATTSAQGSG